ncbi:MAG TPA: DUF427 domain-containing protein [Rhodospirillales bacterium]|nr:DUF427 domain-containing protein [Rhodospirillales bacterium]
MNNAAPGFATHEGYKFDITRSQKHIRVFAGDSCLAETTNALELSENTYSTVYYIPQSDVRMDLLKKTDHSSYCPFKGDASYWTLNVEGAHPEGIAWAYEIPFDESLQIKGHLAFYGDRVDEILIEN